MSYTQYSGLNTHEKSELISTLELMGWDFKINVYSKTDNKEETMTKNGIVIRVKDFYFDEEEMKKEMLKNI